MIDCILLAEAGGGPLLTLGPLDWVIIAIYFVVVLAIGFYLKKFTSTGEDFFLAGRKMTAWIAGLSFISANLSSLETMGWSAMAYQYGMLGAHAYLIGAIPAILFLAVVMMPFYYICKTHSVPGYLKLRYGEGSRSLAGISFALLTVLVSGASMFAMAKILHMLLGWDMNLSIWVASLTVAIYVFLGGLISAVFNEVLQFFLIWLGTLLVPILGMIQAGGWGKMLAMVQNNVKTIHPTFPADVDFTCLWSNLGSFDTNPMGIDWFGMVFGQGLAIGFAYWCTDFLQVQRVMVTKDLRSAQNGTIIGAVLKMCVPLIVTIPGLLGLAILTHADGSPMVLVSETDPRANITHQTYNEVLPLLMGKYLGPGLLGLGVTAMIAGFMSGMAGNVSAFATVWTYDVYRPLIYRNGTDGHYLTMGRWSSIIGVLISIGTAYLLFFFANILDFLQVLIFFFIVPLFGVVILGMLWKRATTAGGFWGFLVAILVSIFMWVYVHSFWGEGYRPQPQVLLGEKTVVRLEEGTKKGEIGRVIVEKGEIETTNVPIPLGDGPEVKTSTTLTIPNREVSLPGTLAMDPKSEPVKVRLLAPKVLLADNNRENKFGIEGVPVVLRPGVQVKVTNVAQTFTPKAFNPDHVQYIVWSPRIGWSADKGGLTFSIARSPHALPMAVNVYSAFWTLLVSLAVTIGVSLFTTPKPHVELTNLVMGLTPIPSEKGTPWHKKPLVWATVVFIVLVAVDIIFW